MRITYLFLIAGLAGCACEPSFAPGDVVAHRLFGGKGVVLKASEHTNLEGYCLVTTRWDDGRVKNFSVNELRRED